MGITRAKANVFNISRSKPGYAADFLVDYGATVCMIPSNELTKIGVKKEGEEVYELASGEKVKYNYGYARFIVMGKETVSKTY